MHPSFDTEDLNVALDRAAEWLRQARRVAALTGAAVDQVCLRYEPSRDPWRDAKLGKRDHLTGRGASRSRLPRC